MIKKDVYTFQSDLSSLKEPDVLAWDMDGTLLRPGLSRFITSDMEDTAGKILTAADRAYKATRALKNTVAPNFHLHTDTKARILSYVADKRDDTLWGMEVFGAYGFRQAIISNNSRTAMGNKVMSLHQIRDRVDFSLFAEDMGGLKKPDPSVMKLLADGMDLDDDACIWMIGDRRSDMQFASFSNHVVPQTIVGVAMGEDSSAARYIHEQADGGTFVIVEDPAELSVLLGFDFKHNFDAEQGFPFE